MQLDSIFDLASLTKVIATLPVILTLCASGLLRLDDAAAGFLPGFSGDGRDDITIAQLLTHTSGLPATRKYYRELSAVPDAKAAILAERPVTPPGTATNYSDIGFMLLGLVAEAVCGTDLATAARASVFEPLGMPATSFNPVPDAGRHYAPTESFDGGPPLRGVVHDRNARLLGGAAGHAGLFAPASDVVAYLRAWTGAVVPPWGGELTSLARRRITPPGQPARGLGWVLADNTRGSFLPASWPGSAGHTGFTGTSVAFHPRSETWVVLLTNAIRSGRDRAQITALRQAIHATIADLTIRQTARG
jgi:CubicO group peptidase (beta-lactamase class C family)